MTILYQRRRESCRAFLKTLGVTDQPRLLAAAVRYERTAREMRQSENPPPADLLMGAYQTARVFYSLAREATEQAQIKKYGF